MKSLKPLFRSGPVRIVFSMVWRDDFLPVEILKSIFQHGAVGSCRDVIPYLDMVV